MTLRLSRARRVAAVKNHVRCPACGWRVEIEDHPNLAVALTAHYEALHSRVPFLERARAVVAMCGPK